MNKKVRFATIKAGTKFSLTSGSSEMINIKVKPARLEPVEQNNTAFNAIALEDGRPRTFHNDSEVYITG